MDLKFLILGGYGQFVWPAFIFTFVSCFILFVKTKKEFQKQEEIFLQEYGQLKIQKVKTVQKEEIATVALSDSSI
tara:strand:+ start:194 stop:418 length:225 start_codon:yes stop_codon:yes gene_type:complete